MSPLPAWAVWRWPDSFSPWPKRSCAPASHSRARPPRPLTGDPLSTVATGCDRARDATSRRVRAVTQPDVWIFGLRGVAPAPGHAPARAAHPDIRWSCETTHGEARMDERKDTAVEDLLEHLIEHGPGDIAPVFGRAFELAMQIERERFLRAGPYERTAERRGMPTATSPSASTRRPARSPSTFPRPPAMVARRSTRNRWSAAAERSRAVMLAVAEMYIKGVSTREVEAVMRAFGIESLSSSQVSRAAKLLDDELDAWRTRPLGEIRYLILDARYEKMRHGGIVRDAAVLSAIGIGPDERRRVLGRLGRPLRGGGPLAGLSSKASRPAACAGSNTWSPTTTPACAPPAGPCSAARNGSAVSSTSPETRHPSRAEPRDPQAHRCRTARRPERSLFGEGRSRPRRARQADHVASQIQAICRAPSGMTRSLSR